MLCLFCSGSVPTKHPSKHGRQPEFCSDACRSAYRRKYCSEWGKANRERIAEYRNQIRDQVQAWNRDFYARHRERRKALRLQRYAGNREHELANSKRYNETHPEKIRALGRKSALNRRARLADVFVEKVDPMTVFERDNGICGICSTPIGSRRWDIDHIVPISKGGPHAYANVQLAHARCNRSKGAK